MQRQPRTETGRTGIQFAEDPRRKPHEKETTFTLVGDGSHVEVESFKKSVFVKLHRRPEFEVKRVNILDDDGREHTVENLDEADSSSTVIGIQGLLPVGAITVGTPRNTDSHAKIVKKP
jgi:hypothetical protein